jgi:hypothetical protein
MRRVVLAIGVLFAIAIGVACGSVGLKAAGEGCTTSSECETGLVCDLGADPHVCAEMGHAPAVVDAPPEVDAPPVDAPAVDAPPVDAPPVDAAIDAI